MLNKYSAHISLEDYFPVQASKVGKVPLIVVVQSKMYLWIFIAETKSWWILASLLKYDYTPMRTAKPFGWFVLSCFIRFITKFCFCLNYFARDQTWGICTPLLLAWHHPDLIPEWSTCTVWYHPVSHWFIFLSKEKQIRCSGRSLLVHMRECLFFSRWILLAGFSDT